MKEISELTEMIADIFDKYTSMPVDVHDLIEILLREIIKREEK